MRRQFPVIPDDTPLFFVRRDLSGGINTRQHEQVIGENQATVLTNVMLDVAGQRFLRSGLTLIEDLSNNAGTGAFGFEPDGGTNELLVTHGAKLEGWTGAGAFTEHKTDFTSGLLTTMVKALESDEADVVIVQNGTDNAFRMKQDHTFQDLGDTNTSPPKTKVMTWYRDRLWTLENNKLSYSGAIPSDFSNTFNRTTNYYNIPVGTERALIGLRDSGLVVVGSDAIWGLNPTVTPAPSTDKPEKLLNLGCVAGNTAVLVADDIMFLANDGVRGLFRTQQDNLQAGQSFPISYPLKDEFNLINWAYISKASAIFFDNKYIIALPSGSSTYNNSIWVYYPAYKAWVTITGWNIGAFATLKINGEERLYGIDANDGSVYRLFYGVGDNGSNIEFIEEGRGEDFGQPLVDKYGGDFKLRVAGGNGTLIISANPDGNGYSQLGTLDLVVTGVTFPTTFPVDFSGEEEVTGVFHLDPLGKFKRIKFKIYCTDNNAVITILESLATTFQDNYLSEE